MAVAIDRERDQRRRCQENRGLNASGTMLARRNAANEASSNCFSCVRVSGRGGTWGLGLRLTSLTGRGRCWCQKASSARSVIRTLVHSEIPNEASATHEPTALRAYFFDDDVENVVP